MPRAQVAKKHLIRNQRRVGVKFLFWKCAIEIIVGSDPDPSDRVTLNNSNGPIVLGYSRRPQDRIPRQSMKLKAGMSRVGGESLIGISGCLTNFSRKLAIQLPKSSQGD
jgi:hypothetical protein